jgi:hypothetical protein
MSDKDSHKAETDLVNKIKNDIAKSGFPLEVEVLNICSSRNTGRMPSIRYDYKGELREIDLVAFFEKIDERFPHRTITEMIIECKKSAEKPWVFFSSPAYSFDNVAWLLKYSSEFDFYFREKGGVPLLPRIHPYIMDSHYGDPLLSRCISYCEAFKSTSAPSEIYRAIDSVISYMSYAQEQRYKLQDRFGVLSEFYVPTVVLDGRLFEARVDKDDIQITERPHVQVRTFHRGELYIIDVVTRSGFKDFFAKVNRLHRDIVRGITSMKLPTNFLSSAKARWSTEMDSFDKDGATSMAHERARRSAERNLVQGQSRRR